MTLLVGAWVIYQFTELHHILTIEGITRLRASIVATGLLGELIFLSLYIATVSVGLPNLPLQLAAGFIYGVWKAFVLMYIGVNIGALLAFLLARVLARKTVEEIWGGKLLRFNKAAEERGFRFIFILRLIPMMPFNAINFGSGLSRLSVRTYVLATLAGTPILTFVHTAVGNAAGRFDLKSFVRPDVIIPLGIALALAAIGTFFTPSGRRTLERFRRSGSQKRNK